ncbi:MAG: 50S ribosomal protein L6 [Patescibacteria group bacterium]
MSRVGKQHITIPPKTEVILSEGRVSVKGPHGELTRALRSEIALAVVDGAVTFTPTVENNFAKALWGTYASHVANMVKGVNEPFKKELILEGVGFKWEVAGDSITLALGFSHPVKVQIPAGLTVKIEKGTMTISGIDKEQVGGFAASIRALKKPEPYKGKGIRYVGEVIRRKEGKKSA